MRSLHAIAAAIILSSAASVVRAEDVYRNFRQMTLGHDTPKEYTIIVKDRLSSVTVIAPHGGEIERGTEDIARALAGTDWNLYAFIAQFPKGHRPLHVTAANFDDPIAVSLSSNAVLGVSVHRRKDPGAVICIGGSNTELREALARELTSSGFECEEPCLRLQGKSPDNIVNLPKAGGVQMELSLQIGDELASGGEKLSAFTKAVRSAVARILSGASAQPTPSGVPATTR